MNNTEKNITSSAAKLTEGQSTNTSALGKYAKMAVAAIMLTMNTSCEKTVVTPTDQVEIKLTPEQQRFADLLAPNKDGSPKSITIDIGDPSSPFYMPKLFRIELKLVNARSGTLEVTPYISKAVLVNALNKTEEIDPGKSQYGSVLSLLQKSSTGAENSLTNSLEIIKKDDNNPLTIAPYLDQLPEVFSIDEFKKYYPNAVNLQKSYIINKTDELQLGVENWGTGKSVIKIKLPIKPVEISAIQNSNN